MGTSRPHPNPRGGDGSSPATPLPGTAPKLDPNSEPDNQGQNQVNRSSFWSPTLVKARIRTQAHHSSQITHHLQYVKERPNGEPRIGTVRPIIINIKQVREAVNALPSNPAETGGRQNSSGPGSLRTNRAQHPNNRRGARSVPACPPKLQRRRKCASPLALSRGDIRLPSICLSEFPRAPRPRFFGFRAFQIRLKQSGGGPPHSRTLSRLHTLPVARNDIAEYARKERSEEFCRAPSRQGRIRTLPPRARTSGRFSVRTVGGEAIGRRVSGR